MEALQIAKVLLDLTENGSVCWEYEYGTPCRTVNYSGSMMVICKATMEGGKKAILLNEIDNNFNIVGKINRVEEGQSDYSLFDKLYQKTENKFSHCA